MAQVAQAQGQTGPRTAAYDIPGWPDAFRSELTKMRTLRSAFWSFFAAVLVVIGLQLIITILVATLSTTKTGNGPNDAFTIISLSWYFGQFAFMVLGVMAMTGEYSTKLVTNTFLATPKRLRVATAKLAAFTTVTLIVAEFMAFVNFFLGHAILSAGGFTPNPGITADHVLRGVFGSGLYATLVGIMGMALGALLRNTALAIVAGVVILFIVPVVVLNILDAVIGGSVVNDIVKYWPATAGGQVTGISHGNKTELGPWTGLLDFVAFIAVLSVFGAWLMNRLDV